MIFDRELNVMLVVILPFIDPVEIDEIISIYANTWADWLSFSR